MVCYGAKNERRFMSLDDKEKDLIFVRCLLLFLNDDWSCPKTCWGKKEKNELRKKLNILHERMLK